jgi:uncharacterized protein (TIGR02594 family)
MVTLRVEASVLNLREGPGKEHRVITRLPQGMLVEQLGESEDGRWLQVRKEMLDGVVTGWVSEEFVSIVAEEAPPPDNDTPPWLDKAFHELGVKELPGPADNPRIVEYHKTTSLKASDDEVAWCSSFVNFCMSQAGTKGSGSAAARSWMQWGKALDEPRRGCVVVLKRGTNPANGHVAFFLQSRGAMLELLGGNQGNQVKIQSFPKSQLLGFRWPRT